MTEPAPETPAASVSILKTIKKLLGIATDYTAFDLDVVTHINTSFSNLFMIGVGPDTGFSIEDDTAVWQDFIGDETAIESVKSYVFFQVKLAFDPPATSFAIASFEKQIEKLEWLLNVQREGAKHPWSDPQTAS